MIRAWVIGSGGLLGSALCRALSKTGAELFYPPERFCWTDKHRLAQQLAEAVGSFASTINHGDQWEIYWSAGVGTMGSASDELTQETQSLSGLLDFVAGQPLLTGGPGSIALASSAGSLYAGSADEIISENTIVAPTTAYAHEKLKQEQLVRSVVAENSRLTALIARISTLYGPGHSRSKQQGLLSHIARCILRSKPIHIYVPLDTMRDYIHADDAASAIIASLRDTRGREGVTVKIIASEQQISVAAIVSIFRRISRRPPKIITSASQLTGLYLRRVQFHSVVAPDCRRLAKTSFLVGISQLMSAELSTYTRRELQIAEPGRAGQLPTGTRSQRL